MNRAMDVNGDGCERPSQLVTWWVRNLKPQAHIPTKDTVEKSHQDLPKFKGCADFLRLLACFIHCHVRKPTRPYPLLQFINISVIIYGVRRGRTDIESWQV